MERVALRNPLNLSPCGRRECEGRPLECRIAGGHVDDLEGASLSSLCGQRYFFCLMCGEECPSGGGGRRCTLCMRPYHLGCVLPGREGGLCNKCSKGDLGCTCEVCGNPSDSKSFLCDICDSSFHLTCLNVEYLPNGVRRCSFCSKRGVNGGQSCGEKMAVVCVDDDDDDDDDDREEMTRRSYVAELPKEQILPAQHRKQENDAPMEENGDKVGIPPVNVDVCPWIGLVDTGKGTTTGKLRVSLRIVMHGKTLALSFTDTPAEHPAARMELERVASEWYSESCKGRLHPGLKEAIRKRYYSEYPMPGPSFTIAPDSASGITKVAVPVAQGDLVGLRQLASCVSKEEHSWVRAHEQNGKFILGDSITLNLLVDETRRDFSKLRTTSFLPLTLEDAESFVLVVSTWHDHYRQGKLHPDLEALLRAKNDELRGATSIVITSSTAGPCESITPLPSNGKLESDIGSRSESFSSQAVAAAGRDRSQKPRAHDEIVVAEPSTSKQFAHSEPHFSAGKALAGDDSHEDMTQLTPPSPPPEKRARALYPAGASDSGRLEEEDVPRTRGRRKQHRGPERWRFVDSKNLPPWMYSHRGGGGVPCIEIKVAFKIKFTDSRGFQKTKDIKMKVAEVERPTQEEFEALKKDVEDYYADYCRGKVHAALQGLLLMEYFPSVKDFSSLEIRIQGSSQARGASVGPISTSPKRKIVTPASTSPHLNLCAEADFVYSQSSESIELLKSSSEDIKKMNPRGEGGAMLQLPLPRSSNASDTSLCHSSRVSHDSRSQEQAWKFVPTERLPKWLYSCKTGGESFLRLQVYLDVMHKEKYVPIRRLSIRQSRNPSVAKAKEMIKCATEMYSAFKKGEIHDELREVLSKKLGANPADITLLPDLNSSQEDCLETHFDSGKRSESAPATPTANAATQDGLVPATLRAFRQLCERSAGDRLPLVLDHARSVASHFWKSHAMGCNDMNYLMQDVYRFLSDANSILLEVKFYMEEEEAPRLRRAFSFEASRMVQAAHSNCKEKPISNFDLPCITSMPDDWELDIMRRVESSLSKLIFTLTPLALRGEQTLLLGREGLRNVAVATQLLLSGRYLSVTCSVDTMSSSIDHTGVADLLQLISLVCSHVLPGGQSLLTVIPPSKHGGPLSLELLKRMSGRRDVWLSVSGSVAADVLSFFSCHPFVSIVSHDERPSSYTDAIKESLEDKVAFIPSLTVVILCDTAHSIEEYFLREFATEDGPSSLRRVLFLKLPRS